MMPRWWDWIGVVIISVAVGYLIVLLFLCYERYRAWRMRRRLTSGLYVGMMIRWPDGQVRTLTSYDPKTGKATLDRPLENREKYFLWDKTEVFLQEQP
jgi:hypothetical protein